MGSPVVPLFLFTTSTTNTMKEQRPMFIIFRDGIGFRFWHHYGGPHGTAIRYMRCRTGLFGFMWLNGGLHVGLWWQVRLELVCIHENMFTT